MSSKSRNESLIESNHDDYHDDSKVLYFIVSNWYDLKEYAHSFLELLNVIQKLDNDEADQHSHKVCIQAQVEAYLVDLWVLTCINDVVGQLISCLF